MKCTEETIVTHFCSGLREDLVLLQYAGEIRLVGDLEEGDSLDRGHCFEYVVG